MRKQWHVLGVGAIGGLFARRLQAAGEHVVLLARHHQENTRQLTYVDGSDTVHQAIFNCEQNDLDRPINRLLVCTKAPQVLSAVAEVAHRLTAQSDILLITNGMGIGALLQDALSVPQISIGSTTAACYRDEKGHWHPVANGSTRIGWATPYTPGRPDWWPGWSAAIADAQWEPDIQQALLEKLAVNAVINPATALLNINNGALLDPNHRIMTEQACSEVAAVLSHIAPSSLATTVQQRVFEVAESTAANTSSMRSDVLHGRETEVEAILGYLIDQLKPTLSITPETPLLDDWLLRLRRYHASGFQRLW